MSENIETTKLTDALNSMILSASGWRALFNKERGEESKTKELDESFAYLTIFAAFAFSKFLSENYCNIKTVVLARDGRPTGEMIEKIVFFSLKHLAPSLEVSPIGIACIPEVMNYARDRGSSFFYISASHNPIGYNGFKFGLGSEGVFASEKAKKLISMFKKMVEEPNIESMGEILDNAKTAEVSDIELEKEKIASFNSYLKNEKMNIANTKSPEEAELFFKRTKEALQSNKTFSLHILCDFNGSARARSIDKELFESVGANFCAFNDKAGNIAHGIIPEGDNLTALKEKLEESYKKNGEHGMFLGYMPDCDGDRGNVVYIDKFGKACILKSQEVFCLAVVAEILHAKCLKKEKIAAVANGPTSLLLEELAASLSFSVFRSEVGEANVVKLAKKIEKQGYYVRIFGEGSNGGSIVPPSLVRDPLNTLFALLKFFLLEGESSIFCAWKKALNIVDDKMRATSFSDIVNLLPKYHTTPVAEERAILKVKIEDVSLFRRNFQKTFLLEWQEKKGELKTLYGFGSYKAFAYVEDEEIEITENFAQTCKGGFKIVFYNEENKMCGFIWMRSSGTEPVFRVMADVKGGSAEAEANLLQWHRHMIEMSL